MDLFLFMDPEAKVLLRELTNEKVVLKSQVRERSTRICHSFALLSLMVTQEKKRVG